jgi:hypothetical protein
MQSKPRSSIRRKDHILRTLVIAAGLIWSTLFVIIALVFELQLYADGAMFSYAVAVQDVWAFHWHNIASRASVFLLSLWPAEMLVGLTGSPAAGIFTYGFLFYVAPLAGLIGTFAADRSRDKVAFVYACASTALLCPLVFGFPTEMWIAHAVFWPTFAISHYGRQNWSTTALLSLLTIILVLTHAGGIVLAIVIVATLALHGFRDARFRRGAAALAAAMAIWAAAKIIYPPDDYFADVLVRAALHFFDPAIVEVNLVLLLIAVLAGYGLVFFVLSGSLKSENALVVAMALTFVGLLLYWVWFDYWVHASNRYYLRTLLVVLTPAFAFFATLFSMPADGLLSPRLRRTVMSLADRNAMLGLTGAFVLVTAVHIGQTAYFITDWRLYKTAVKRLATGTASDPALGDPRFVSTQRISSELNQLGWFSTVEYLSIIVAGFNPARLAVDPAGNYFWLSCKTATENAKAERSVPASARELVRIYSCLHR